MQQTQALKATSMLETTEAINQQRNSLWWDAYRRFKRNKIGVISFWIILGYVIMALLAKAGILYPSIAIPDNLHPYGPFTLSHPFGTDIFGRDCLGRAIHGGVTALSIGFLSSSISLVIGLVLGGVAGYFGGWVDSLVVRLYTTIDSVPPILLIPALAFVLGRGLTVVYIAVGVTSWVGLCRLIRAEFMKHKERDYVAAAKALGASHQRRIFLHIMPNVMHLALIQFSLGFVGAIKFEVLLSYLGVGVEPSVPSWGIMLDDAKLELARPFWGNLLAATVLMFGLVLAFNLLNDALRESLDPKLKNK